MIDVAFATCRVLPEDDRDEALLLEALRDRGIDARMLAWDDEEAAEAERLKCDVVLRAPRGVSHLCEALRQVVDSQALAVRDS